MFKYRLTPHSTTGVSPAELLLGRCPHSHFDFMLPNLASKVRSKEYSQKMQHDKKSKPQIFSIGSNVLVCNFSTGPEWLLGISIAITDQATDSEVADDYIPIHPPTTVT